MGFSVLCKCDNCGKEEKVKIFEGEPGEYLFNVETEKEEDTIELTDFEDLTEYTEKNFRAEFLGGSKCDPNNFKLLCGKCREKVRKIDRELEKLRQERIHAALKGS